MQVYDTRNAGGVDWNMIGPNEWVETRVLALVTPKAAPPEEIAGNRWTDDDLADAFWLSPSHWCVNLSVGDALWAFQWANVGDYVYVYDTTGQTPTDPALYPDWAY